MGNVLSLLEVPKDCVTIFKEACETGETDQLASLILANQFQVNESLPNLPGRFPLLEAIGCKSSPVVKLILDHGGYPNYPHGKPLARALKLGCYPIVDLLLEKGANPNFKGANHLLIAVHKGILEPVATRFAILQLLLDRGADLVNGHLYVLHHAVMLFTPGDQLGVLGLMLDHATKLGEDPEAGEQARNFGRFSRICKPILEEDEAKVSKLLGSGDYGEFEEMRQMASWDRILRAKLHCGTWAAREHSLLRQGDLKSYLAYSRELLFSLK